MMRRFYVGMTRAKNSLFVHTNSDLFNYMNVDRYNSDARQYEMPDKIVLQLSHKDVNLGFFKDKKKEVLELRSGSKLIYNNFYLYSPQTNAPVAKLSQRMQIDLSDLLRKGYKVTSASVRFIVAWKPKNSQKSESETAVLLADITLSL